MAARGASAIASFLLAARCGGGGVLGGASTLSPRVAGARTPPPAPAPAAVCAVRGVPDDGPGGTGGGGGGGGGEAGGVRGGMIDSLIEEARTRIADRDADGAFEALAEAHGLDPAADGLPGLFEACLRLRIDDAARPPPPSSDGDGGDGGSDASEDRAAGRLIQDRFGLASLLIDRERYGEASEQLRAIVSALSPPSSSSSSSSSSSADGGRAAAALERASAMLYRSDAACCRWDGRAEDGEAVSASLDRFFSRRRGEGEEEGDAAAAVPVLHPFDALKFPCVSLGRATEVAAAYARRAEAAVGRTPTPWGELMTGRRDGGEEAASTATVTRETDTELLSRHEGRVIKVGYLSPDLTAKHPLAFLMQRVFGCHDRSGFRIYVYSLSADDGSPEVRAAREGSDEFVVLPRGLGARDISERIRGDGLDVMVDLCGYAGPSLVAEVMATRRCAPLQVSYMGFPGSTAASYVDYAVFDAVVVPPDVPAIRRCYSEAIIYMPHCYFVNSHKFCARDGLPLAEADRAELRERHGLPRRGFVYCCHSRPDKVDPATFRRWLAALARVRAEGERRRARSGGGEGGRGGGADDDGEDRRPPSSSAADAAALWLLRSGSDTELNLRTVASSCEPDLPASALVFCDAAPRDEHLRRLGCADLFLDTPAYNAHTLGCDALWAGVPMISLLRPSDVGGGGGETEERESTTGTYVATDKLASRVGASLLLAAGLPEMVCGDMMSYEDLMVRCALDPGWYGAARGRLLRRRREGGGDASLSPLFDTERWVRNLERGLRHVVLDGGVGGDSSGGRRRGDVMIADEDGEMG